MNKHALTTTTERFPALFDDFFKPWNEWFDNDNRFWATVRIPSVNITENKDEYNVSLAVPGMKKEDFKIDVNGNMLTISCEKDETKEEKDKKFTRKEYNYSSFSRNFSIPDDVKQDAIDAHYENGVLNIKLPRKEESKRLAAFKKIAVK